MEGNDFTSVALTQFYIADNVMHFNEGRPNFVCAKTICYFFVCAEPQPTRLD